MRSKLLLACVACLAGLLTLAAAQAVEVKLQVAETDQVARDPAVVTTGVPFARGEVKDATKLSVSVGGKAAPAQFIKLAPWDDGSVRWALMDVQVNVPAGGKAELAVTDAGTNPPPAAPVQVADAPDAVSVSTGPLRFVVNKKNLKFNLFESLKVDGKEVLTSAGRGLVLTPLGGAEVLAGPPTEVKIEQAGPLRAIVCVRGKFPGVFSDLLSYTVRISAFAGQRFVKVHVWLENNGAKGWFHQDQKGPQPQPAPEWFSFKGLAVDLGLGFGPAITAKCEGVASAAGAGPFKVLQLCRAPREKGRNKGPFYTWDDFEYTVSGGGKELKKGDRTDGVVELAGGGASLTVAIRDFWQNYEKSIEQDGTALKLWLWPMEGRWPRSRPDLQDGATIGQKLDRPEWNTVKLGPCYTLQGGVHKGHEFILDFTPQRSAKETRAELSAPLMALASADRYAGTEAAGGLFAPPQVRTADRDANAKLDAWMRMTLSVADPQSPTGIVKARQTSWESLIGYAMDSGYWFGWMDFGDLAVPGKGHVGLHYDWIWIMLLDAMRTGDMNFMRLAGEMARHRIDIDQFWSDRDLPEFRALQQVGTYPSYHCNLLRWMPQVGNNWLAGVAAYYMFTGEPKALECCTRNAEGLRAIAKTRAGPRGDMEANAWAISSFCAMYDLTADKKWLAEAMGLFNDNVVPKWKALGPFLHDPRGQIQSQDYIQEDMKYCYAIASLCELHHLTGDATVLQLLQEGCQKDFPDSFFEAPVFLSDLYAYVGLVTKDPKLVTKAADLFAQGFPESKSPPVFLPDNSTWSRQAAMTLRTGHILQYANWRLKPPGASPSGNP